MTLHADLTRELARVERLRDELRDPISQVALSRYASELEVSLNATRRVTAALDELRSLAARSPCGRAFRAVAPFDKTSKSGDR